MQIPNFQDFSRQSNQVDSLYQNSRNMAATNRTAEQKNTIKQEATEEKYQPFQTEFQKAINDWLDEYFTGLTEEEREEIREKIKEYLEEYPIETDEQVLAFQAFVRKLYASYGFKGYEYTLDILDALSADAETVFTDPSAQKAVAAATAALQDLPPTAVSTPSQTECEIITESDGTQVMIVTTSTGLQLKIKIGEGDSNVSASAEEDTAQSQNQNQDFVMQRSIQRYENNFIFAT